MSSGVTSCQTCLLQAKLGGGGASLSTADMTPARRQPNLTAWSVQSKYRVMAVSVTLFPLQALTASLIFILIFRKPIGYVLASSWPAVTQHTREEAHLSGSLLVSHPQLHLVLILALQVVHQYLANSRSTTCSRSE